MRPRVVVAVIAAVVFGTASGALVGGYLALPSDGVWAVTVGTEMAGFVPLGSDTSVLSVEGLYRQVLGGTAAGALVGAGVGVLIALALRAALRRRGEPAA